MKNKVDNWARIFYLSSILLVSLATLQSFDRAQYFDVYIYLKHLLKFI